MIVDTMSMITTQDSQSNASRRLKRSLEVLSEEDYTSQLEHVIEQQFFPHLSHLRNMLDYLDANETFNINTLRKTYEQLFPTIPAKSSAIVTKDSAEHLTVSQFFSKYISEDNQSFLILQEKALQERRRKFHWVYEACEKLPLLEDGSAEGPSQPQHKAGMLMLYYIGDKVLSAAEREELDKLLSAKYVGPDQRPTQHNASWGFRVRNQLMFYPELKDSEETCDVTREKKEQALLLMPPPSHFSSQKKREKKVQVDNVQALSNDFLLEVDAFFREREGRSRDSGLRLEETHTPSTVSSLPSEDPRVPYMPPSLAPRGYKEVAMSPAPLPGHGVLASPLMTWGEVSSTPLRIEGGSTPLVSLGAPQFHMQSVREREQIALRLAEKRRRGGKGKGAVTPSPSPSLSVLHTPLSSISRGEAGIGTGGSVVSRAGQKGRRKFSDLTPAAQALVKKLGEKKK